MKLFWTLWGIDAITAFTCLWFFIEGVVEGDISERNMGQWILIMLALGSLLGGSWYLKSIEYFLIAKILLSLLAIPAIMFVLFFSILILTGTKWQ